MVQILRAVTTDPICIRLPTTPPVVPAMVMPAVLVPNSAGTPGSTLV